MSINAKTPKRPGPRTEWAEALGASNNPAPRYVAPPAIQALIREKPVKKLLNKMATNEKFKAKTLAKFQEHG
jgi:hypothetical protein